jgi:NAD(P)-dependent dehydrogenase (short-subunit alcohol dehydrogenase family)
MTKPLTGKVAVVTGASRGIGRAIAERLARDGALVAVHYCHDTKAAGATVKEIEKGGGAAFTVKADFASLRGVRVLFERLDEALKERTRSRRFDILVNNAGISTVAAVEETTEAFFDKLVAVNLKAPFFIVQQSLSRLRDGGRIINISSGTSRIAFPEKAAYSMLKAAVNTFTLLLAKQLGPRGITVNSLAPGIVRTDAQAAWLRSPGAMKEAAAASALGRVGMPEDIADVAGFLASSDSRWVTGAFIDASGGSLLG